jgi:hypothetical protein
MKEPKRIKLNDTPSAKDVKKIRLFSINSNIYDITMLDDTYIRPDNDSIYTPLKNNNENNSSNHP